MSSFFEYRCQQPNFINNTIAGGSRRYWNLMIHISRYLVVFAAISLPSVTAAQELAVTVKGEQILLNQQPIKLIGLRCSNALISDQATDDLIGALDLYNA